MAMMNVIYERVWNPLHNHYIPQEKTLHKVRLGSKYKRTFRKPMTPHDVLVDLTNLPDSTKGRLMEQKLEMNPFHTGINLRQLILKFSRLPGRHWSVWPGRFSYA